MKIALYQNTQFDFESVFIVRDLTDVDGYVRISEFVEIDFPMLPKDVFAQKMMASFDEKEKAIRLQFANALAQINAARQEFMALSHDEVAA